MNLEGRKEQLQQQQKIQSKQISLKIKPMQHLNHMEEH